jgi:uncharacterized RDD family membrane protein YckC
MQGAVALSSEPSPTAAQARARRDGRSGVLHGNPIDTLRLVATPEGCEIPLRLAGPLCRARAWLLDALIRVVILALAVQGLAFFGEFGGGLILVAMFAIEWLYPVLFEVYGAGATPGKRMSGLVVLHDDGTPVGWPASVVRNTVRFVDFLPAFYATAFVAMLLDPASRRLGDLAAGTVVVYSAAPRKPEPLALAAGQPPPPGLEAAEQRALIEYARRADRLTPERAEELALLAEPLSAGLDGPAARKRLLSHAAYLLGRG